MWNQIILHNLSHLEKIHLFEQKKMYSEGKVYLCVE